jgi:hypothetical protein
MGLRAQEIFVPGSFPQHTYIERRENLEQSLRDAISTPGQIVSLSGPSKSGKTVLVEKVVGRDSLITITGASIDSPDEVWNRILDWMNVPNSTASADSSGWKLGGNVAKEIAVGIPSVAQVKVGGGGEGEKSGGSTNTATSERRGLAQVIAEIADSEFVILIDDFHYMRRDVQVEVAKSLKEAVRQNLKIVTAAVTHRGDDVVRANPELRGRVLGINLGYWQSSELRQIAEKGFEMMGATIPIEFVDKLVAEAAGSPQLMQSLCLQSCFVLDVREASFFKKHLQIDRATLRRIFEQTSASTDFRSLVDVLDVGPRTRGTERTTYNFRNGGTGDVYRAVLKGVAADPPQLSFQYDELLTRTRQICVEDSPVGSSVTSTCVHVSALSNEKFPTERVVDWDEQKQVFDVSDPLFLFYLRWSGRLDEGN